MADIEQGHGALLSGFASAIQARREQFALAPLSPFPEHAPVFKRLATLSPGGWIILALAVCSSLALAVLSVPERVGSEFWIFARNHQLIYDPVIAEWNAAHPPEQRVRPLIFSTQALERRLLSGFLSGTPLPALAEIETGMAGKFFSGPLDAVGFLDLTERLREENLIEGINAPSFAPWTSRGHIFGLPHDVHPVLLAYRADIVEAAGIDVSQIETWDDFARIMRPLMPDADGDGYPDRYLISLWETNPAAIEVLMLQAGGNYFDANDEPIIASETNARVIAQIVNWTAGPGRIATHAPDFDAAGNQMFLEGYVLCNFMPDWLLGVWMQDLPGLAGKVKVMPLPAWEPGGRRTSVRGGTMLGISRRSADVELSWEFAKHLYLSREVAEGLFRGSAIISPVKAHWSAPFYDTPNPYLGGQKNGQLYITAAPDVPIRTSSPYKSLASERVTDAVIRLKRYAENSRIYEVEALLPQARAELAAVEESVRRKMATNHFLTPQP